MAFYHYISIPGFTTQMSQPLQYHVFQQPMVVAMSPLSQFLAIQQQQVQPVVPLPMTTISSPPVVVMPVPISLPLNVSILPPGAPPTSAFPPSKGFKVIYFGHATGEGRHHHPWCGIHAAWENIVPSRDGLLAAIGSWTGLHGLTIRHAGGRIDAAKVKLVVTLDVDERVWEEAVRDIRRESFEAIVVVDMSASVPNGDGDGDGDGDGGDGDGDGDADGDADVATTTADATPAPTPAATTTTD
ncbi:hypothetical protein TrVFT333_009997 [Trichoderma virens FT-333]|nr:hypothetical protein TrVFT333_009997 [Trichoderma virens FT-333]